MEEKAKKARVLIVDDEDRFRHTLRKLLEANGYNVEEAGDGYEALEKVKESKFDVILLDVKMPGMHGVEVLAKLKKLDPLPEVIILTGHASVDIAVQMIKLGGYEYLLKPCPTDEIIVKIDEAHEKKKAKENLMLTKVK